MRKKRKLCDLTYRELNEFKFPQSSCRKNPRTNFEIKFFDFKKKIIKFYGKMKFSSNTFNNSNDFLLHFFTVPTLFSWAASTVKCEAFAKCIYTVFQHDSFPSCVARSNRRQWWKRSGKTKRIFRADEKFSWFHSPLFDCVGGENFMRNLFDRQANFRNFSLFSFTNSL